jgi:hypothetical protein
MSDPIYHLLIYTLRKVPHLSSFRRARVRDEQCVRQRFGLIFHNCCEGLGIEARAADQCAVDFFFRHERSGVFGLY